MNIIRFCLDCNQEIVGRKDKKFCSDHCRVNFHNTIDQEKNKAFRRINSILIKNRNILSELFLSSANTISRTQLKNAGFNFNFHTHILVVDGKKLTFIYDYGFESIKLSKIKLLYNPDFLYPGA